MKMLPSLLPSLLALLLGLAPPAMAQLLECTACVPRAALVEPGVTVQEAGTTEAAACVNLDFDGGDFNVACTGGTACTVAAGPNVVINGGADVGEAEDFAATVDLVTKDLRVPSAANATISTAGALTVDTTRNQLVYYGTALSVLDPVRSVCVTIENLVGADDDYVFWIAPQDVTVTSASCYCAGANCSDTALFAFEDNSANAMTGSPTCATTTGTATWTAITAGGFLSAGEALRWDVSSLTENGKYTVCVTYKVERG